MAKSSGGTRSKGASTGGIIGASSAGGEVGKAVAEVVKKLREYETPITGDYISETDRGLTEKQKRVIEPFEERRRNSKIEYGLTVDKDGNIVKFRRGGATTIWWGLRDIPKDGILTHVHPLSKEVVGYGNFYKRVGSSFSGADIKTAIIGDLAEIRAVTPNYTFSMRRPNSGWGVKPGEFKSQYDATYKKNLDALKKYADAGGDMKTIEERYGRLNVLLDHWTMKELADKYGFIYSKSRRIK